jgi:hypothetical protein
MLVPTDGTALPSTSLQLPSDDRILQACPKEVQGLKDVGLFPATDRELVRDQEVENCYSGNFDAVLYRQEMQDRGIVFRLAPGEVLHHPALAPHWAKRRQHLGEYQHQLLHEVSRETRQGLPGQLLSAPDGSEACAARTFSIARQLEVEVHLDVRTPQSTDLLGSRPYASEQTESTADCGSEGGQALT